MKKPLSRNRSAGVVHCRKMPHRLHSPFDRLPYELLHRIATLAQCPRYEVVYATPASDTGAPLREYEDESEALQFAHEFNRRDGERPLQYIVFDEVTLEHGGDISTAMTKKLALVVMRREVECQQGRAAESTTTTHMVQRLPLSTRLEEIVGITSIATPSRSPRDGFTLECQKKRFVDEVTMCRNLQPQAFPTNRRPSPEFRTPVKVVERATTAEVLSQLIALHPHWRDRHPSS